MVDALVGSDADVPSRRDADPIQGPSLHTCASPTLPQVALNKTNVVATSYDWTFVCEWKWFVGDEEEEVVAYEKTTTVRARPHPRLCVCMSGGAGRG